MLMCLPSSLSCGIDMHDDSAANMVSSRRLVVMRYRYSGCLRGSPLCGAILDQLQAQNDVFAGRVGTDDLIRETHVLAPSWRAPSGRALVQEDGAGKSRLRRLGFDPSRNHLSIVRNG